MMVYFLCSYDNIMIISGTNSDSTYLFKTCNFRLQVTDQRFTPIFFIDHLLQQWQNQDMEVFPALIMLSSNFTKEAFFWEAFWFTTHDRFLNDFLKWFFLDELLFQISLVWKSFKVLSSILSKQNSTICTDLTKAVHTI